MFKKSIIMLCLYFPFIVFSQNLKGKVSEINAQGSTQPLPGVNVYISDKSSGTITDAEGNFSLDMKGKTKAAIVFSFVGYKPDTVNVSDISEQLDIVLSLGKTIKEVTIAEKSSGAHILRMEPILVQTITTGELKRAACCNLAESFETNASVDVQYNDAVSGARQIQMLGLSGIYSQVLFENMPYLRGLGIPYGLEYLPGSWLESIYISKGTSSVINGYESITGQINAELKKPEQDEETFVNVYADAEPRYEVNLNRRFQLDEDVQTMLFAHYHNTSAMPDHNHDGFIDLPMSQQVHLANNWNYHNDHNGFEARWGIRGLSELRKGGQTAFFTNADMKDMFYGTQIKTNRVEGFTKTGYMFKNPKNSNFGFINSLSWHDMESFFGRKTYSGQQIGYYSNLIFNTELWNKAHNIHAGLSMMYDTYKETLNDSISNTVESVPGIFAQYTYSIPEQITFIAGIRADHHSRFGTLITPRIHIRYPLTEHLVLRTSAGKGYRSPRLIAENIQLLASSRNIIFEEHIKQEEAWNAGANLSWHYKLLKRDFTATIEFYYTTFQNQAIIDLDKEATSIRIYNLQGKSYSSYSQFELSYTPIRNFDVRTALRYNDVKTTYNGKLQPKYLVNNWKFLFTAGYMTINRHWQFDGTLLVNGRSHLPDFSSYPEQYQLETFSPVYSIINLQVTRNVRKWSFYAGVENLLNFTQHNPIIAWQEPFGQYFDSSVVWGPLMGRKIYAGIRYSINKPIKHEHEHH